MGETGRRWICRACWDRYSPGVEPEVITVSRVVPVACAWCGAATDAGIEAPPGTCGVFVAWEPATATLSTPCAACRQPWGSHPAGPPRRRAAREREAGGE